MNDKATWTITSLLSILFFLLHWADEVVRGRASRGAAEG